MAPPGTRIVTGINPVAHISVEAREVADADKDGTEARKLWRVLNMIAQTALTTSTAFHALLRVPILQRLLLIFDVFESPQESAAAISFTSRTCGRRWRG